MAKNVQGFDYTEIEFERSGIAHEAAQSNALLNLLAANGTTDVVVMAHGWNNDMKEARDLYADWLASLRAVIDDPKTPLDVKNRKIAFAGVLWPSKRFTDDELIPGGGAASLADGKVTIAAQIDGLKVLFTTKEERAELTKLKKLAPKLETDPNARAQFVETFRKLLTDGQDDVGDTSPRFFELPGQDVFSAMASVKGKKKASALGGGGAAAIGGAAGIGDFFRNAWEGARNVLNYGTYYEMKARAGLVGGIGLNEVLRAIQKKLPNLRIHLVGHSFGGRVVAAAADGPDHGSKVTLSSLTLLQAAFSHHGFAKQFDGKKNGFFRGVVETKRVSGPILVTYSKNDKAVGVAYPLASRMNGENAASIGDADDQYGGIGTNGAVKTPEALPLKLLDVNGAYKFTKGKIHNLESTKFVKSHGDVAGKQVAYATLCAIAMT